VTGEVLEICQGRTVYEELGKRLAQEWYGNIWRGIEFKLS